MSHSVAVLGGGLAGMAAALRLVEADVAVTLVETRKVLGGRATSFNDPATGQTIDNCQHVLLKCCTNLLDFYDRLGVTNRITWHPQLHFFDKQGHHDILKPSFLPAPNHLSLSMLRFKTLDLRDKLAISKAMLGIIRTSRQKRRDLDVMPFSQWLTQHGQTQKAIDRFWAPIAISACNQLPDQLSTNYALQVFQEGFLAHRQAYVMGTSNVPLGELYAGAIDYITQRGGRVLTGSSVHQLRFDGQRITGVDLAGGRSVEADTYISALPFDRLARVLPVGAIDVDERLQQLDAISVSPILGIHLWYERSPIDWPHMVLVDSPLQWVFNKGFDEPGGGYCLHGVVSAADEWVGRSSDDILDMAQRELAAYTPRATQIKLVRGRVIKEKRATFAAVPNIDALRPQATGKISNLVLAGDWCATGWPATMEGAVRSGYAAAQAVAGYPYRHPDLPAGWLYRLLSVGT